MGNVSRNVLPRDQEQGQIDVGSCFVTLVLLTGFRKFFLIFTSQPVHCIILVYFTI
jgi:hypothetical protein